MFTKSFQKRDFRRLKGHVQLMGAEDEEVVPGPYTKTSREEWLRKLLQAQNTNFYCPSGE